MLIRKLLVATRGATAARIIATAKSLGLRSVAVYSAAEPLAYHALRADERVAIGEAPRAQSYGHVGHLLQAASSSGADAVHPGGQPLAQSAFFAAAVRRAGLNFIGPPTAQLARLAVPQALARRVAAAGLIFAPQARGTCVEVQLAGDARGAVQPLGDWSCLRRTASGHRSIVASPAPQLRPARRAALHAAARRLGAALGLQGLLRVRFAADAVQPTVTGVSARLSPAYAALERAAGLDLLEWQLRLAMGELLPPSSGAPSRPPPSHCLQATVYARGPARPLTLRPPPIDVGRCELGAGGPTPPSLAYGRLLCTVIAEGPQPAAARRALAAALAATEVSGMDSDRTALYAWACAPQSGPRAPR